MNAISPLYEFITTNPITSYFTYATVLILYTCNKDLKSYDNYYQKLWYMSINTTLITLNPITHIFVLQDMYANFFNSKSIFKSTGFIKKTT